MSMNIKQGIIPRQRECVGWWGVYVFGAILDVNFSDLFERLFFAGVRVREIVLFSRFVFRNS